MRMNEKRESRYVKVARIAYQIAQQTLPRYTHPKSPHTFTFPQRAACVLLMFYLKLSYRDMEEWLLATDQVCGVLELTSVPDHSTLARTVKTLKLHDLDRMRRALLDALGVEEEVMASDGTGFSPTQASAYYQTRTGRTFRAFVKGIYTVGTQSQLILAWRSGRGPGNDVPYLSGLRRDARQYGRCQGRRRAWMMRADAGFDGTTVQEGDLIPPVRRGGALIDPARVARAELVAAARLDGVFGQRWKRETVISVIKHKFGDAIRARLRRLQLREPTIKGLVYDLHV